MLILLPPSEAKRDGGAQGTVLDPPGLRFPSLSSVRLAVQRDLKKLSSNLKTMAHALKLGRSLHGELMRNRVISSAPTLPAMDRYTGVLYDAMDAASMSEQARSFLAEHVVIHSALFGLVGAGDLIPAYRLSHDSKLPNVSLKRAWATPIAKELEQLETLVLDLRSEAYVALGRAPIRAGSLYLRVVAQDDAGRKRALNHFNKKGKGEFVRAIAIAGIDHPDAASLCAWANQNGFELSPGAPGELELVVSQTKIGA